jgi:DNA gyrase subunit A
MIVIVTTQGRVKATEEAEYPARRRGGHGMKAIQLTDAGGMVAAACVAQPGDDLLVLTRRGQALRFPCPPASGRATQGVQGIGLRRGDEVVAVVALP